MRSESTGLTQVVYFVPQGGAKLLAGTDSESWRVLSSPHEILGALVRSDPHSVRDGDKGLPRGAASRMARLLAIRAGGEKMGGGGSTAGR